MNQLQKLGWEWTENGAIVTVATTAGAVRVFVPLRRVFVHFSDEMHKVGAPLPMAVGACPSVSGLFSGISHAFKKATRAVKKVVPKAITRAASKVTSAAYSFAKKRVAPVLSQVKRIAQSPAVTAIATGLSFTPLAPVGASVLGAQAALKVYDMGMAAANRVKAGVAHPGDVSKMLAANNVKSAMGTITGLARGGDPKARQFMTAMAAFGAG